LVGNLNASTTVSSDTAYATTATSSLIELHQSTSTIPYKIAYYANKHHLEAYKQSQLVSTIKCESNFNPIAVSSTNDYGIAQINLSTWKITKQQAFDVDYSLDFMADKFEHHQEHNWICYRLLFET
jgi:soluble lytic murein transglycosylase-like protein